MVPDVGFAKTAKAAATTANVGDSEKIGYLAAAHPVTLASTSISTLIPGQRPDPILVSDYSSSQAPSSLPSSGLLSTPNADLGVFLGADPSENQHADIIAAEMLMAAAVRNVVGCSQYQ